MKTNTARVNEFDDNFCISRRYCDFSINRIFGNFPSVFPIDVMEIDNKLLQV